MPQAPVTRAELLDLGAYEQIRKPFVARIIAEKKRRRVALGPNMSALFENHDSVLHQVQEMLRTERITREAAIAHELATYNELVPPPGELSVTVFVEYPNAEEREQRLVELAGLERCFYLRVDGERLPARSETRGVIPGRTTALHYLRIPLGERVLDRTARLAIGVAHAAYEAETTLAPDTVSALVEDLE